MKRNKLGLALAAALALVPSLASAATVTIISGDPSGVGFNDATPVSPVGGNTGTTLGQQRMIAFQAAANKWGATLAGNITIRVSATWTALTCVATQAILGNAGATEVFRDFPSAPVGGHWYPKALANQLANADLDSFNVDISASFNVNLGKPGCLTGIPFYLGLDNNHGSAVDLMSVVIHELGHGLGFQTFTNGQSGTQFLGIPSIWDNFLLDADTNKTWTMMSNAERAASAVKPGRLVWNGGNLSAAIPQVLTPSGSSYVGADSQGRGRMYAPASYQDGSSVTHFDTAMSPNQIMEPAINGDLPHQVTPPQDLTFPLLKDIGWSGGGSAAPVLTISKSHTGSFVQNGQGAYSIVVSNTAGSGPTSGQVTVTEVLPGGLSLVSMSGSGWTCPGGTSCTRTDVLNAGFNYAPITVTVNVSGSAPASLTNQATVSGGGASSVTANDPTQIGAVPGQVTLTAPGNGATNQPVTPTLSWSAPTGATAYDLYLGTSASPSVYVQNLSATTYTVSQGLTAGSTYYWKVVAKNGAGSGAASSTWSFVTAAAGGGCTPGSRIFSSSTTWTAPAGCSTATFEVVGGGGGGESGSGRSVIGFSGGTGGGGGGGGYSNATAGIAGGSVYTVTVGTGGFAGSYGYGGGPGSDSFVQLSAADVVRARGGSGGGSGSGGRGGTGTYSGGAGAMGATIGGGGGGAGSESGPGSMGNTDGSGGSVGGGAAGSGYGVDGTPGVSGGGGGGAIQAAGGTGGAGFVKISWSGSVTVNPPGAVTLSSPANGASNQSRTPTLSWSASSGATSYDLYLGTTNPPAVSAQNLSPTSYTVATQLTAGTTYYWNVVAKNGGGSAAASTTFSFTTGVSAPPQVTLNAPANGATAQSVTPTLSWSASSGATSYDLYLGTSNPPAVYAQNLSPTSYTVTTQLTAGTIYYWNVVAKNSGGSAAASTTFSFTTGVSAPPQVTLTAPANGATAQSITPTLSWSASSGATSYDLYLGTSNPPAVYAQNLSPTSDTVSNALTAGTTYYWNVVAKNSGGSAPASTTFSFTTGVSAPPQVTLTAPANGATAQSITPTLTWSASSGATSYDLYLGTTNPPSVYAQSLSPTSYTVATQLTAGTTYYWNVVAKNSGGSAPASTTFSFTTRVSVPPQVTLTAPANGATAQSITPTLGWSASSGATSYDLYLGTSNPPAVYAQNLSPTSYTVATQLTAGTTYYWNVVAKNSGGSAPASTTFSFTTAVSAPPQVTLTAPANGATAQSITPTLTWSASSGATSYDLYLGTTNPPSVYAQNLSQTSYTVAAQLTAGTIYYWNVVAKNSGGSAPASTTFSFTTAVSAPPQVTLTAPATGATAQSITPTLSWSASSGATSYDLYLGTTNPPSVYAQNLSPTSYTVATQLTAGTTYYWNVVAKNGGGSAPASTTFSFTTRVSVPPQVTLTAPATGATAQSITPTLSWSASSGATSYDLYLGTTNPPAVYAQNLSPTSYTVATQLTAGTTYYWNVVAKNGGGSAPASTTFSFTTAAASGCSAGSQTFTSNVTFTVPAGCTSITLEAIGGGGGGQSGDGLGPVGSGGGGGGYSVATNSTTGGTAYSIFVGVGGFGGDLGGAAPGGDSYVQISGADRVRGGGGQGGNAGVGGPGGIGTFAGGAGAGGFYASTFAGGGGGAGSATGPGTNGSTRGTGGSVGGGSGGYPGQNGFSGSAGGGGGGATQATGGRGGNGLVRISWR